jgi:MoaA/NifB/PqqE/SkfB family radical SAM enzyme
MKNNFFFNEIEKHKRSVFLKSHPKYLHLELTTVCNNNCIICYRNYYSDFQHQEISKQTLDGLKTVFPHLNRVIFGKAGDPLTSENFCKVLDLLDKKTEVFIVTSLLSLTDEHLKKLKRKKGIIRVSIDALDPDLYKKTRGGNIQIVLDNIIRLKKETDLDIWICTTLHKLNFDQLEPILSFAQKSNISTIAIYGLNPVHILLQDEYLSFLSENKLKVSDASAIAFKNSLPKEKLIIKKPGIVFDYTDNFLTEDQKKIVSTILHATQYSFRILDHLNQDVILPKYYMLYKAFLSLLSLNFSGIFLRISEIVSLKKNFCPVPWERYAIRSDSSVQCCCHIFESIGDLKIKSFMDIWNGEPLTTLRKTFSENQIPERCHDCPLLKNKKRWI